MYTRLINHLKRGFESLMGPLGGRSNSVSTLDGEDGLVDSVEEKTAIEESISPNETQGLDMANRKKKSTRPTSDDDTTDPFLRSLLSTSRFKNWIKVALALRIVCEYISPVLEEVIASMHKSLLEKHGKLEITQADLDQYRKLPETSVLLYIWMKDVVDQHRTAQMPAMEILLMCDPTKWPTEHGAWEIARAFMKRACKSGEDETNTSSTNASFFDVSSLLYYMIHCKAMGGHVNTHTATRVLKVRDSLMHNARFQVDNKTMRENFETVLELFHDKQLLKIVDKTLRSSYLETLEKIKTSDLDLRAIDSSKPKSTDPKTPNPSGNTLRMLQDTVSQILSEIPVSAESAEEIENKILNIKEYFTTKNEEQSEPTQPSTFHALDDDCILEDPYTSNYSRQCAETSGRSQDKLRKRKIDKSSHTKSESSAKRKRKRKGSSARGSRKHR